VVTAVKLPEFVETGQPRWSELDQLISAAGRRAESLGAERLRRFVDLYRATSADLAIARRLFPHDPVLVDLENRVVRARGLLFDRTGRRESIASFFGTTYWRLIVERRRPMALAAAALLIPAMLGALWAVTEPARLIPVLPPGFLWVIEAETTDQGYGTAGLVGFSTYVMQNNIRVTLLAFVLGITWGLMTGYVIVQNGLILGALAGLAVDAGNGELLIAAIAAHGILELSCIVIGGGTGFSMARSMLRPGHLTRRQSLGEEARAAALVALGTAPWLILAGLIEGFVSRTGTGWAPSLAIGIVIGGGFWFMVWRFGRVPDDDRVDQRRALALARR
jgi:uncharacterized membrane protein SpoIIM required for sporulation